tara:strand:+ start:89 stop:472 length:384 start_codon:yes stop_codon:yes gene_type:complete
MVKHRRFSDKPRDSIETKNDLNVTNENLSEKSSRDIKSILTSGTKYIYIIAATALLSGIFTPLTSGAEVQDVIFGMLTIFLGLAGGIVIFLGIRSEKFGTIMIMGGLGALILSLVLIYEVIDKSLFS